MKKFKFDFNDFNGSLTNLYEFVDSNLKLNVRYHVSFVSKDCKVINHDVNFGSHIADEFKFLGVYSVNDFIGVLNYKREMYFYNEKDYCNCETLQCFKVIFIYFLPYRGNLDEEEMLDHVYDYEDVDCVRHRDRKERFECIDREIKSQIRELKAQASAEKNALKGDFIDRFIDLWVYGYRGWIKFYLYKFYSRFLKKRK